MVLVGFKVGFRMFNAFQFCKRSLAEDAAALKQL